MPKYKLEEFQAWLAADPARKESLSWDSNLNAMKRRGAFGELVAGRDWNEFRFASDPSWQPYCQVALKWKAQVDHREIIITQELNQKLQADNKDLLQDIQNYKQKITNLEQNLTTLQTQLTTQQESTENLTQALTQQKTQWNQHIQQTKSQLQQEITLIKEVLHG